MIKRLPTWLDDCIHSWECLQAVCSHTRAFAVQVMVARAEALNTGVFCCSPLSRGSMLKWNYFKQFKKVFVFYFQPRLKWNNKSSAVAEMGDRGRNKHGPKRGGFCAPFAGEGELCCVRREPSSPPRERGMHRSPPPLFSVHVYCGHGRPSQLLRFYNS